MALAVQSRLWLGASVHKRRTKQLITDLAIQVRKSLIPNLPVLIVTDGLKTYIKCFQKQMALRMKTGKRGRPKRIENTQLVIAQCVKGYVKKGRKYLSKGVNYCLLAHGSFSQLKKLLNTTQSTNLLHTAYIERLNADFRQSISCLTRRSRYILKKTDTFKAWIFLKGTTYNFCSNHASLSLENESGQKIEQSPAMVAKITNRIWSIKELLEYRTQPPLWKPSRGRRSKYTLKAIQKYRPDLATI